MRLCSFANKLGASNVWINVFNVQLCKHSCLAAELTAAHWPGEFNNWVHLCWNYFQFSSNTQYKKQLPLFYSDIHFLVIGVFCCFHYYYLLTYCAIITHSTGFIPNAHRVKIHQPSSSQIRLSSGKISVNFISNYQQPFSYSAALRLTQEHRWNQTWNVLIKALK